MAISGIQITGATFTNGSTIGAGGGGGGTSFTVGPADIQVHGSGQWYHGYSNISATDFTSDGDNLENGVAYNITYSALYNQIVQIYTNAGFNLSDNYAWNVTWTIGGTGVVRLAIDAAGSNTLVIAPIDQTDTRWQTGDTSGPTQPGTFGFPATFTLHSPTTQLYNNNQWC
jgi:hypothetical protein